LERNNSWREGVGRIFRGGCVNDKNIPHTENEKKSFVEGSCFCFPSLSCAPCLTLSDEEEEDVCEKGLAHYSMQDIIKSNDV
jgi:hypothetical protein